MFFREQTTRQVHGRAGNMGVNVDAAGHYHHAAGVNRPRARGNRRDDSSLLDADVSQVAVDAVCRIVDVPARDAKTHGGHECKMQSAKCKHNRLVVAL